MATPEQLSEMRKNIASGYEPPCAVCKSKLTITPKDGNDGSKGFRFECSNPKCELKSGFVKIPWYSVIFKSATKQLVVVGILAITVLSGGLTYFINKLNPENKDNTEISARIDRNDDKPNDHETDDSLKALLEEKDTKIKELEDKITEIKNKPASSVSESDRKLIWEAKLRIGIEKATSDRNTSKEYLMDVLDEYDKMDGKYALRDAQQAQIMEILADHIANEKMDAAELKKFENYVVDKKYSGKGRKFEHLGLTYYHLAGELGQNPADFYANRAKSLLNYLKFFNSLREAQASEGVLSSLRAAYDSVRNSDYIPTELKRNKAQKNIYEPQGNPEIKSYIAALEAHMNDAG